MTPEQIKRLAEELATSDYEISSRHGSKVELFAKTISRHMAEAKEAEQDIAWMRACIAEANANGRKFCHDVTTDRLIRILDRLEGVKP